MADNVSAEIRDDLIEQEVRYRRTDAAVRQDVDRRLLKLEKDLMALAVAVDPNGAKTEKGQRARLMRLEKASNAKIREAYTEIDKLVKDAAKRVAKIESQFTVDTIRKHLP